MKVFIGADHRGFRLKSRVITLLGQLGYEAVDQGTYRDDVPCDYPPVALSVAKKVVATSGSRGILICMSGIGPTIAANKVPGAYAALCYNRKVAELSRQHNDTNILVLGAKFIPSRDLKAIIKIWLTTAFEGGRHLRRIKQIKAIEKVLLKGPSQGIK